MHDAEHVHFIELAGPAARALLAQQAERWRAQGVATTLLRSAERDDLWLLVGSSARQPPPAQVAGARSWRFRRALEEPTGEESPAATAETPSGETPSGETPSGETPSSSTGSRGDDG